MRYLGGKFRQSKQIVTAVAELHPDFAVYVEPFCGAMWAACRVIERFPGRRYILTDSNPWLIRTWQAIAYEGWEPPEHVTEEQFNEYKREMPLDDPLTAVLGFSHSFSARFFSSPARNGAGEFTGHRVRAWDRKIRLLRASDVEIYEADYRDVAPPSDAMVYLDPPYAGRAKQWEGMEFDDAEYMTYARRVGAQTVTIATDFCERDGWVILHDYGDTIRRPGGREKPKHVPETRELLMLVT